MMNHSENKAKIIELRKSVASARELDKNSYAEAYGKAVEEITKMKYKDDLLHVNDTTLDMLFGKPEAIDKDYLI